MLGTDPGFSAGPSAFVLTAGAGPGGAQVGLGRLGDRGGCAGEAGDSALSSIQTSLDPGRQVLRAVRARIGTAEPPPSKVHACTVGNQTRGLEVVGAFTAADASGARQPQLGFAVRSSLVSGAEVSGSRRTLASVARSGCGHSEDAAYAPQMTSGSMNVAVKHKDRRLGGRDSST